MLGGIYDPPFPRLLPPIHKKVYQFFFQDILLICLFLLYVLLPVKDMSDKKRS